MKRACTILALLSLVGFCGASPAVRAQSAEPTRPDCRGLEQRLLRQGEIDAGFRCQKIDENIDGAGGRRQVEDALTRCSRADQAYLATLVAERGRAIETCVGQWLKAARQAAREDAAAAGTTRGGVREMPAGVPIARSGPKTASERILELLAAGPSLGDAASGDQGHRNGERDLNFRSGLVWSYAGPITGMHCVQWREPSDPHNWEDNYLCTERDIGFQWSFRGPILGRGLKCIQVREKSDPHDWHDNYFCWPRDLKVAFRFSAEGRIPDMRCLAIIEPEDPHTWRDNFLCHAAAD